MILRELSPARAECLDDLSSIFEALQHGECALRPFLSLVGDLKKPVERVSSVGGIAGKLACSVGDEGILVVRRSVLPLASLGLNIIPVVGKAANQVLSGAYDLLGGGVETTGKRWIGALLAVWLVKLVKRGVLRYRQTNCKSTEDQWSAVTLLEAGEGPLPQL